MDQKKGDTSGWEEAMFTTDEDVQCLWGPPVPYTPLKFNLAKWLNGTNDDSDDDEDDELNETDKELILLGSMAEGDALAQSVEGLLNTDNKESEVDNENAQESVSENVVDDDAGGVHTFEKAEINVIGDMIEFEDHPLVPQYKRADCLVGTISLPDAETAERFIRVCGDSSNPGPSRNCNKDLAMQRAQENVEDQIFFEEFGRGMKDLDAIGDFQIGSQDLDLSLNMNSQDLLRYAEIGNFSGVCDDDVLNKTVYGDGDNNIKVDELDVGDDTDDPKGMRYVLALKTGIDSAKSSKILFNENPCFTNYAGDYDFDVIPAADAKKCIYAKSLNKIYVSCGTYEFLVKMNFDLIPEDEEFLIRTHVNFVQPEYHQLPVLKCISCQTSHQKIIEPENVESLKYVARASYTDRQAVYYQSTETSKLYFFQPVVQPELGCDSISKGIVFTCMNSCRGGCDGSGINRREIALVFTLLNKMHQVVGRRVFTLRICTAPHRDAKLDLDSKTKTKKRPNSGEEKVSPTKRQKRVANELAEPKPGPSSKIFLTRQQDNNVSSSQETCYSGDEDETYRKKGLLLRSLFRQSTKIMGWKGSKDPRKDDCFKNLFRCLRMAQDIINSSPPDNETPTCSAIS